MVALIFFGNHERERILDALDSHSEVKEGQVQVEELFQVFVQNII